MFYTRDLVILFTKYLKSERKSLRLLKITKIDLKHYTSKRFLSSRHVELVKFKSNKVIINSLKDLFKISKLICKHKLRGVLFTDIIEVDKLAFVNLSNLKILIIKKNMDVDINILPKQLRILDIYYIGDQELVKFPEKIEKLALSGDAQFNFTNLKKLKYLYINPVHFRSISNILKLPKNLKYLHFGPRLLCSVSYIQKKVKVLICHEGHLNLERHATENPIYPDKIIVSLNNKIYNIRNNTRTAETIRKSYHIPKTTKIVIDTNENQDKYLRIHRF